MAAEVSRGFDGLVDGLAGHEPGRELTCHPVPAEEIEDSLLFRKPEKSLSHYQLNTLFMVVDDRKSHSKVAGKRVSG